MKALFYILRKSLKNYVLELRKKPLVLVLYVILLLAFIGMITVSFIMPTQTMRQGSPEVFQAIVTAGLLFAFYMGVGRGIENGGSFFRMADVNLVFTAPLHPKRILVYGFINQLFSGVVFTLFIAFQIPNLKNNFAIKNYGVLIIYLGILALFIIVQFLGILVYSVASRSGIVRSWFKRGLNAAALLVGLGFMVRLFQVKDAMKAAVGYLGGEGFDYVPILGWFRVILVSSVTGVDRAFFFNTAFILITTAILVYILYRVNTDYFEDVLAATEKKEELVKAVREGKARTGFENMKLRRVQSGYAGKGASAIFFRQLLEHRKTGILFINRNTLIMAAVGIGSQYFFPHATIMTVLYFTIYTLFFFTIQGKWVQELGKPYIYLIPGGSTSKVFYATLADSVKNAVDGLILFGITGFIMKSDILTILLCALTYTTFGAIYTYGDVLAQRLLGAVHSRNLAIFIKMFLILFVIAPGLITSIILTILFREVPYINIYSLLLLIAYNVLASGVILLMNRGIFQIMEMR